VVAAHVAPSLARGGNMPRGLSAPMLMLQGLGKAEIAPDGILGLGALMMSWGLGRGRNCPRGVGLARGLMVGLGRRGKRS
jgi:hypothetical protein